MPTECPANVPDDVIGDVPSGVPGDGPGEIPGGGTWKRFLWHSTVDNIF